MIYAIIKRPDGMHLTTMDTDEEAIKDWIWRTLVREAKDNKHYMQSFQYAISIETKA